MAEHPDRAFFQAFALTLLTNVLSDIRCWAEQPHHEPLPKDWDCTYRRDLSAKIEQAVANFAGDSETVARLRRTERLARDVVSAMSSSVAVSSKPAVEWPEAYAAYFQKMLSEELFLRELRDSLDAKDRRETKRRRQPASDTHAAAPSDAGRIGRDELHDRNGVTGGGTSAPQTAPEWSKFRTPIEWRALLEQAGKANAERTWTDLRKKNSDQMEGDTRSVRITRSLANQWGLKLPEFTEGTRN